VTRKIAQETIHLLVVPGGLPIIVGQYSMEHVITTPVRIILHALMWRKVTLAPVMKDSLETPVNTLG